MAATSAFTEGASVFGGQANLLQAINNIFTVYEPDVIAVHTTCLSETIGDDIPQIVAKARDEGKIPPGKYVIHANTPSYVGSHVTGFANMVKGMVDYSGPRQRPQGKPDQHDSRLRGTVRHGGDQAPGRGTGGADHHVPRHLQRAERSPNRQVSICFPPGAPRWRS